MSVDLAWAAGFFDGDGNISVMGGARIYLRLQSTERPAVDRLREVLGTGTIRVVKARADGRRPSYVWCVANNRSAAQVLDALRPYLVAKAPHAALLERFIATPSSAEVGRIQRELSKLNHRRFPGSGK